MRVLHVIARMNFGGTARYLVELHDGLTANGIENFIAAGHVEGKESIDPSAAGIRIIDIASLARSLVGMQAIRSAASPEPASVGGFIESLVIDRASGIRWVHRLPQLSSE